LLYVTQSVNVLLEAVEAELPMHFFNSKLESLVPFPATTVTIPCRLFKLYGILRAGRPDPCQETAYWIPHFFLPTWQGTREIWVFNFPRLPQLSSFPAFVAFLVDKRLDYKITDAID
jgi:hypothetical protein